MLRCAVPYCVEKMEALVRLHFVTQEQNTGQTAWLPTNWVKRQKVSSKLAQAFALWLSHMQSYFTKHNHTIKE